MTKLLERLFPRPRRPFHWSQVIPLLLFLVGFAALCVSLEWFDKLMFVAPWAFWLMLVTPWIWWLQVAGGSGLGRIRGFVALWTRLALIGLFVMLLAEPRAVRTSDHLSVIYTVDISDSVGRDTDIENARIGP